MLLPLVICYIISLLSELASSRAPDYCHICPRRSHTMCMYKHGPSRMCNSYQYTEITKQRENAIVNLHNKIRSRIATGNETHTNGPVSTASNMYALSWDIELEIIAERWADQCISIKRQNQNDLCRKTERFQVGQNVFSTIFKNGDANLVFDKVVHDAIFKWYKGVSKIDEDVINKYESSQKYDAYTQMIWGTTQFIGCAHVQFSEKLLKKVVQVQRLVCNYAPAGNINGLPVYQTGVPAANCTKNDKYAGICAPTTESEGILPTTTSERNGLVMSENEIVRNVREFLSRTLYKDGDECDCIFPETKKSESCKALAHLALFYVASFYQLIV